MLHHSVPPLVDSSLLSYETVTIRSHNRNEDRGDYNINPDNVLVGIGCDRIRHKAWPRHGFVWEHL